jgi:hypothetical protein
MFLFLVELGMISYPQEVWNIEEKLFSTRGMLKFTYNGGFLRIKKTYQNFFIEYLNGERIL